MTDSVNVRPAAPLACLSIIMPARDEDGCIAATIQNLYDELKHQDIRHEIVVVDDGSTDGTWEILETEQTSIPTLRAIRSTGAGRSS